ncbi:hypothetical protein ACSCBZ_29420 [Streptomyces niveiscabiei]|uniref:hypothetical protein n=1 Tax=Streptomyces niveiscabiei TaxID=164115 RepID=UPI000B2EF9AA
MQLTPRTGSDASAQLPPSPRAARHACANAFNTRHSSPSSPPGIIPNASRHRAGDRSTSYTLSGSASRSASGDTGPGGSQETATTRGVRPGLGVGRADASGVTEGAGVLRPTVPPSSPLIRGAGEEVTAGVDRTAEELASGTTPPPRTRGVSPS